MRRLPTRHGAHRPDARRRALGTALVRVAAIAGFAFAGWLALSSLNQSAYAAQSGGAGRGTERGGQWNPVRDTAGDPAGIGGLSTLRHFRFVGGRPTAGTPGAVAGDVREAGEHPITYLGERGRDAAADGGHVARSVDRTARGTVRKTADAAGVPELRLPDVRTGGAGVGRLVHGMTGPRTAPHGAPRPAAHAPSQHAAAAHADGHGTAHVPGHIAADRHAAAKAPSGAHRSGGHCRMCGDGHRLPGGPAMPSEQDGNPRSGPPSGGHPFGPVADLGTAQRLQAPHAAGRGAFHRTALTDEAAPGRPSVVPD
ncbi:hypothetical protein [Actinomadura violacea]|uniref:Uncharacterized protein n=1 Tax=Actinomadura violacea TaxID=2819934 RepID=A0ABS3S8G2_9ACTN|nr:hypothetical protein [Actinomadura violacea]MBO2464858.1 hypothetical protein [Actinomadura violacea]